MSDPVAPLTTPAPHLAVLDDEPEITEMLTRYLGQHGFRVSALHRAAELWPLMQADPPALVLLDLGLPDHDGLTVARRLRELHRCGLVIVTGRDDAVDRVVGLEVGADDYVTKPFERRELLARIRAVLRRVAPPEGPDAPPRREARYRFEHWTLDAAARRLSGPDGEVTLTGGEFELLRVFVEHPGRVLSRDFLLERTRGRESGPFDRSVDMLVGRLRRKLGDDPDAPRWLKSVRGAGYILVSKVESP